MANTVFDYDFAFSRNIGWITHEEQQILKNKRVAIAGLGGAGGSHLITLARLGIGKFNIADFDCFELANFNRQAGASMSRLNRPKVDVLEEMALDVNPTLDIKKFSSGVTSDNLSEFLTDVDVYLDGVDFFAFAAREAIFAACAKMGIPAVTAAPLGMSVALINFMPGQMSFEDYFQLQDKSELDKILHFLVGLSPAMLQSSYLVDPAAVDLPNHKGPSTPMGCELCAGFAGSQALKIVLKRDNILAAPWSLQFDAYRCKLVKIWRPWGNRNPLQRLSLIMAKRHLNPYLTRQNKKPL
jgi:molybdopterin/thiamine biosynthesis adenylyltransferase